MNILILSDDKSFSETLKKLSVFSKFIDLFKTISSINKLKTSFFSGSSFNNFDLIFLDLDFLKDDLDSIIFDFETYSNNSKIIAFSNYDETILKSINKSILKRIFKKDGDYSEVVKYLSVQFNLKINIHNDSLEKYNIMEFLNKIGFSYSHIGTKYILDSIFVAKESNLRSLNKIYDLVSDNNNVSKKIVTWNINYAVEKASKAISEKAMQRYLKIRDNRRPTAKQIILYVADFQ